ncbi:MAG: hypothetical protein ACR2KQ_00020 [Actinomycetota bacterium]
MASTFTRGRALHARIYDVMGGWCANRDLLGGRKRLVRVLVEATLR